MVNVGVDFTDVVEVAVRVDLRHGLLLVFVEGDDAIGNMVRSQSLLLLVFFEGDDAIEDGRLQSGARVHTEEADLT